jgi:hypothetical protein
MNFIQYVTFIGSWFCGALVPEFDVVVVMFYFIAGIFLLKVNDYLRGSDPYTSCHVCDVMKRLAFS